ncbi:MAG: hypothetical protein K5988_11605 [Lachnospiraceae bacterium]|nr:hypothetical protein [Lachnospiraceae bacterium]
MDNFNNYQENENQNQEFNDNSYESQEVNSTVSFSDTDAPEGNINVKQTKNGLTSLIIGLIFTLLNCGMGTSALLGGPFIFGGLLIILPIYGVVAAFGAFKQDGGQKIMGIFGLILNIIAALVALVIIILGFISKLS